MYISLSVIQGRLYLRLLYLHAFRRGMAKEFLGTGGNAEVATSEAICNLKDDEDESYFGGYGHFSIHQTMLQVTVTRN